ncbi:hypothetical protein [Serratia proteamaculans]|uniref:hypothetical protein n=1 Tax=Serratia proteamaculans TaxID=28151 RepID=UPI002178D817|nr:hypothetical protein [Serratia proteamaculans]CAI0926502.1 Uncharacterised protein [Serratia proteamaculans]
MFKYELGQTAITTTGEACSILGRAEYSSEPNMYLLSWPSDNGTTTKIWFKENVLTAIASTPQRLNPQLKQHFRWHSLSAIDNDYLPAHRL